MPDSQGPSARGPRNKSAQPSSRSRNAKKPQAESAAVRGYPVVGIGASAGGLAALKQFFQAMPADAGMAYVVVLHLDPEHESHMAELLGRVTDMKVVTITDGMPALPDRVHVIPPDASLTIRGGLLRLGRAKARVARYPIDEFLHSLAVDQRERAIAMILTGTGTDGSRGIREIKSEGGLVLAQDPERSEHDGMPCSAIATGLVDQVVSVKEMPQAIMEYVRHARLGAASELIEEDPTLKGILTLLKARGNFDFGWYKRSTVQRRVRRRMGLTRKADMGQYLQYLRNEPAEVQRLVDDLLIGVTAFFREREAWESLRKQVVKRLVEESGREKPIRAWVPACSTGEEAYTLAIVFREELDRQCSPRRFQIFATDVDESSLEQARSATYPERAVAALAPERLERFFVREGERYRVRDELRECVVFAQQNLISDSPFSRLDLISCRNLFIYLEAAQQQRVLSLFHFVIRDGGYLFLGNSETIGKHRAMFATVSKKWRIYRRIGTGRRPPPELPAGPHAGLIDARRSHCPPSSRRLGAAELARNMLLDHCSPAAVLVDRNADVLYFHGETERYLSHPAGEPTSNLLDLARRGLRGRLRAALHRATGRRERVVLDDIRLQRGSDSVTVQVSVIPWSYADDPEFTEIALVTFTDAPVRGLPDGEMVTQDDHTALVQLEDELRRTKEELQSTIEELETANEELKVSNEEAMSMNEELQSTNEELETSKEELQSLNQELTTINSQLEDKVGELQETTDALDNLLVSSNIATLFLDREFRIKRFTPALTKLMRLIDADVGRPIADISSELDHDSLTEDSAKVLEDLLPVQREVRTGSQWYLRRVLPYRTQQHRIEGVVITYVDITQAKLHSEEHARLAAVVSTSDDGILTKDLDGTVLSWNRAAERMYGYSAREMVGRNIALLVPDDRLDELRNMMRKVGAGQYIRHFETERLRKDGRRVEVLLSISPVFGDDGELSFLSSTHRDISEIKAAHREVQRLNRDLQLRLDELQTLVDVAPVGISIAHDRECRTITTNPAGAAMLGALPGDNISLSAEAPPRVPYVILQGERQLSPGELPMQRAARDGIKIQNQELQMLFADGSKLDILMNAEPLLDEQGEPRGAVGVFMDIAERKRTEVQLRQQAEQLMEADRRKDTFLAVLGHELRNPLAPIRNIVDLLRHSPDQDRLTMTKAMDMVGRQVDQLTRLVDDLLDVARISHDDIRLRREFIDLAALCEHVVEDAKPLYKQHAHQLRYCATGQPAMLYADPVRIAQIISNLLHNASNYTPEGGIVEVALDTDEGMAVVKVRDDGVGIPTEDQQAIFDPFSHTASRIAHHGKAGLGLGLTLSQRLVQMHGGEITVYSEGHGHGSEFTVRLPLTTRGQHRTAKSGDALPRISPKRIMLVEDNLDVCDALTTLLTALGHDVRAVHVGAEAVGCADDFQPQVAFIDIGLPDMDGYEVARRLRARQGERGAILVALSGYGRPEQQDDDLGPFDEYLLKPLSFDRIGELLSNVH